MRTDRAERTLQGLPVSAGIAIGPLHLHDPGVVAVSAYVIAGDAVEAERARFHRSVAAALRQIDKLRSRAELLPEPAQEAALALLEVHRQMLSGSRLVRGVDRRIAETRTNAEAALEVGLVNRVLPPTEANAYAQAQARKLAAKPLSSLMETKRLMKQGQQAQVQQQMGAEGESFRRMLQEPAAKEAFTAFMEKRKPDFSRI